MANPDEKMPQNADDKTLSAVENRSEEPLALRESEGPESGGPSALPEGGGGLLDFASDSDGDDVPMVAAADTVAAVEESDDVDDNAPPKLVFFSSGNHELDSCDVEDDGQLRIQPVEMTADVRQRVRKREQYTVVWTEPQHVIKSAAAEDVVIHSEAKHFGTEAEAEAFAGAIRKQISDALTEIASMGGLTVSSTWLANLKKRPLKTHIRAAASHRMKPGVEQVLPLDPRFLGIWLGDGNTMSSTVTTMDVEILRFLQEFAAGCFPGCTWTAIAEAGKAKAYSLRLDTRLSSEGKATPFGDCNYSVLEKRLRFAAVVEGDPSILANAGLLGTAALQKLHAKLKLCKTSTEFAAYCGTSQSTLYAYWAIYMQPGGKERFLAAFKKANPLHWAMWRAGVWQNKRIPAAYFQSSRAQRLQLLAGLLDTDGSKRSLGSYEIMQKSIPLSDDITRLARELGYFVRRVTVKVKRPNPRKKKEDQVPVEVERMAISGMKLEDIPCLIPYKQIDVGKKPGLHFPRLVVQRVGDAPLPPAKKRRRIQYDKQTDELLTATIKEIGYGKWSIIKRRHAAAFQKFSPYNLRTRADILKLKPVPPVLEPEAVSVPSAE